MIYKDKEIDGLTPVATLEFGKGDICVSVAQDKKHKCSFIIFKNIEVEPVGKYLEGMQDKTIKDLDPEIIMIFDNPASINVVIEMLLMARMNLKKMYSSKSS